MSEIEIWKDIPEYEGLYQVSNLGRIRSLDRMRKNGKNSTQLQKGKIMTLVPHHKTSYLNVMFCVNDKRKLFSVHRLVAKIFIPNTDANKTEVNHKNGIKADNRVDNLEWVTPLENRIHSDRVLGKKIQDRKIIQYDLQGNIIATFNSVKECAEITKSNRRNIQYVLSGSKKTHRKTIFKYAN